MSKELPALLGGEPVRKEKIYYGRQWIGEDDIEAVANTLRSDFITCGPKVEEMESKLCQLTGAKYAVSCTNGTSALHLACLAAGVKEGDEVITTPLTFMASANCARYCGATVVFADINPDTYNIDPKSIREKITDKTKAIVAVDFTGQVVEAKEIREILERRYKLKQQYMEYFGDDYNDSGYIFTRENGERYYPSYPTHRLEKFLKRYHLPHIRWHDLRHSCASVLYAKGWKMKDISDWLGHTDIQTTMNLYGHLDVEYKKELAETIDGLLES